MDRTRTRLPLIAAGLALCALTSCRGLHSLGGPNRGQLVLELGEPLSRATASVLYLEPESGQAPRRGGGSLTEVASDGASFRPALTVVRVGDDIRFVNRGALAHRIFITSRQGRRERFVAPEGRSSALRISESGEHRFYCSLHPDEGFVVFGAPSRHFLVPDGGNTHRIRDLHAGSYRLRWWSEAGLRSLGVVEIRAGETAIHAAAAGPSP